jgi:hypothetical protein
MSPRARPALVLRLAPIGLLGAMLRLGLLINFHVTLLRRGIKRVIAS